MVILRVGDDCNRQGRNRKATLPEGGEIRQRNSVFGFYDDSHMVVWLKGLALDPCKSGASRESNPQMCNQILNVRKVMLMTNSEFPRRKRKLQQFLKGKFKATRGLASEKYNQQNFMKLSRGQFSVASSVSCIVNSADLAESLNQQTVQNSCGSGSLLTSEDDFHGEQMSTGICCLDNVIDFGPTNKDSSPLINSYESISGSNPPSPENQILEDPPLLDAEDMVHSSNSSSLEPKQLNLRRLPIPVGPRFQAKVPEWTGLVNKRSLYGGEDYSENSRWLGTQIWPVKGGRQEITSRKMGKGRPDFCSCTSPGSVDCIKHHILEERLRLQSDIGPAFFSWKFDEMGEDVSKSWTLKEQKSFESLMKMSTLADDMSFWSHARKYFPTKCKKSILSYYFNVYIPKHISQQIRSSLKQVDSDGEEAEDVDNMNSRKKSKTKRGNLSKSEELRTRYLCQTF